MPSNKEGNEGLGCRGIKRRIKSKFFFSFEVSCEQDFKEGCGRVKKRICVLNFDKGQRSEFPFSFDVRCGRGALSSSKKGEVG